MVFQNDILAGASGTAVNYPIDQSIRFNRDDSAYLTRTPSSASNRRTFTLSFWWKMCTLPSTTGGGYRIIQADSTEFGWSDSNDNLYLLDGGTLFQTSQVFRDPSAWQHIVLAVDTTDATAGNRIKLYINGSEVTNFASGPSVSQNFDFDINNTVAQNIGKEGANYIGAYVAEFHSVDGTQLDATSFGKTNDDGVWIPKAYSGNYGTNGFYLKGQDSAALGDDSSGNSNDFTSSGLTSDDQRADTPTNNMMTFNPLNNMRDDGDPTDGNRVFYNTGSTRNIGGTTFHFNTGKYVQAFSFDGTGTNNWQIGSQPSDRKDVNDAPGSNEDLGEAPVITPFTTYYVGVGLVGTNNTGITADTADTIWVAMDLDSGKQWIGLYDDSAASMIWFDSSAGQTGDPDAGLNPVYTGTANRSYNFALCSRSSTKITLLEESEATGTVPTGFTYVGAVQDAYATPAIADGSAYFQTTLYTGTGSTLEVNQSENSTFQPDFVWIKRRNAAVEHALTDAVRGVTKELSSNDTGAEETVAQGLTTFGSAGFTVGSDGSYNTNTGTYAAWQWLAANGTAPNGNGSIASTVSANTTAGFSIVGYTGNGTAGATVGHGLGVKPSMLICKNRDNTEQWIVYQEDQGATKYGLLNSTATFASSSGAWNNTEPTSSVVTLGGGGFGTNVSSNDMIMYAFAEVEGFSKFGSYTGNGSTDGPFVWCGFRPAFVMFKKSSGADSWEIFDNTRPGYNATDLGLFPNTADSESTGRNIDILSNGIKQRNANGTTNQSGSTYIFMAFAEHPFGGDGVVPVPAR
jgi:hypothetical protein